VTYARLSQSDENAAIRGESKESLGIFGYAAAFQVFKPNLVQGTDKNFYDHLPIACLICLPKN
jgi:hypothetical protein